MKILVTGGAGYIGSHTAVELLDRGFEIVIIDNFVNSLPRAVDRIKKITGKDFKFYEGDVRSDELLDKVFTENEISCIIHFAGLKAVGESVSIPADYYDNNINSTLALARAMKKYAVKDIIFSSSATVYSPDNPMPLVEGAKTGCSNPYGWTKFMCEQILTDISHADGINAVLLRYFNPIGAHESGEIGEDPADIPNNLMPYISQTAIGKLKELTVHGDDYDTRDGTGVRDYIHVVDLAKGHAQAIEYLKNHKGVSIFNLGTGAGTSVLEMVGAFEEVNHVKVPHVIGPRRPGDIATCYADPKKAKEELGWEAESDIRQMVADSWKWQKKNPNGYRD